MIRCVAIDDEPLALKQIESYIAKIPYLQLVASCCDAFEAMRVLETNSVDLIFVDINMPDYNGMDFVKQLQQNPYVIFTTAYSEYAIEGYKVDAVDYLLKPFTFNDLLVAVNKVKSRMERVSASSEQSINADYIFVKCDYKSLRVNLSDIIYIEGMSEYVKIYVEGVEKPLMPLLSMKKIEDSLPKDRFVRVHKSYIVNASKISCISRMRIFIDEETIIPISDGYKDKLNAYIGGITLGS